MRLAIFLAVFDVKAEVIKAGPMPRFFGVGGIQDRQVHFAIGKMDRAVLGAVHLFHVEHLPVESRELVRLMRKNRQMTELGHLLFLP